MLASRVVSRGGLAVLVAAASLGFVPPVAPQLAKIVLEPAPSFGDFGHVALDDDWLAVGASGVRQLSGAVFVYDRGTGGLARTLTSPDGAPHDTFGFSVALHSGSVVVAAPQHDDVGWAGVYDAASGAGPLVLRSPSPFPGDRFGEALDIDAARVAVGAPGNLVFPPNDGKVDLFERATGALVVEIPSPLPGVTLLSGNGFGRAVALDGGLLLVGAPETASQGRAWMYDATSGQFLFGLEPPTSHPPRYLGASVALGGGRAAVGDPSADDGLGVVHVYDAATGGHLYSVVAGGDVIGGFGNHVALDAGRLAVGAQWEGLDDATGVVRVYDASDGALLEVLTGRPAATSNRFGISLDLRQGVLAVGDTQDDQAATSAGAAYLVDVGP